MDTTLRQSRRMPPIRRQCGHAAILACVRFHLSFHRETKENASLCVDTGQGRLERIRGKGAHVPHRGSGRAATAGRPRSPAGYSVRGASGGLFSQWTPPFGRRGEVSMAELVRILAMVLGWPVLNRTGFAGQLDVRVDLVSLRKLVRVQQRLLPAESPCQRAL
jgi:uncharacterized protein (TIGR03435 family)